MKNQAISATDSNQVIAGPSCESNPVLAEGNAVEDIPSEPHQRNL
jgi:hypothetical protein